MNTKELKQLRGQLRQIVKELLPEAVTPALLDQLSQEKYAQLIKNFNDLSEKHKNLQAYVIRSLVTKR